MSTVIGIDPGPTPGVVRLHISSGRLDFAEIAQVTPSLLFPLVRDVLGGYSADLIQVEHFVARGRATKDQSLTRDQVANLSALFPAQIVQVNAAAAKAWATDARLEAAGLAAACKGMRHARDAARHALYGAVKSQLLRDPLSKGGA